MNAPQSMARQNSWLLAAAFILIELLTLTLFITLMMLPLARRAASDLAELMVLSAQTWAERPPPAHEVFEVVYLALFIVLLGGLLLLRGFAVWLAWRITAPLARLEQVSALMGRGISPSLVPEARPREMVAPDRLFNAMSKQVQDLLSARTTLLAGVSHDLRTPLARMRLALELLKLAPKPDLIERLERDVEQMNRLIGNVLDLARGLAHEPAVRTNLVDFLTEVAEDFSTPACQISVRCPPGQLALPRLALHRALGNLLQNALRYAPAAPVELVCEWDTQHCRLGILDRGPGIACEQIEAMFQPFQRLAPSRSPVTDGSGLGLAIVRELACANGWQVTLQPRQRGGLQAWLELPIRVAATSAPASAG